MMRSTQSYVPCHLLSNFLTHSFFNVLDKYLAYTKHPHDPSRIQDLLQSTQSFLFIHNQNPHALAILNDNIFTHYIAFDELSQNKRRNADKLSKIRKNYSKALLKATSHDSISHCNHTFIQLYYTTLFSSFDNPKDLPILYTLSSAEDFVKEVKNIRHRLLKVS